MSTLLLKPLGEFIEEQTERLRLNQATIYSVTNENGFVRSLELFDKQVFSADTGNYKRVGFHDLAYNPSRINVGSIAICEDKEGGAVSPMYVVVRCKSGLLPRFLLHFLKSEIGLQQIRHRCEGAVRFQLKFRDLCKIPMFVPSLSEQERILKLLDEAAHLQKARKQADSRIGQLIPAIFHEMFGDPIENPKKFPIHPVSSFVSELQGGRSVKPADSEGTAGQLRVLKVSAVTWGKFKPEESKPVEASYLPPKHHFVQPNDLLFSRANTTTLVGATSYVFDEFPNLLLPDKIWRFIWKQPATVDPLFMWSLFQSKSIRKELGARATGTGAAMKNISKPKVMSLKVPIPPLSLQQEFGRRVNEVRDLETDQAVSRKDIERLFQSLLHDAFSAKL